MLNALFFKEYDVEVIMQVIENERTPKNMKLLHFHLIPALVHTYICAHYFTKENF